MPRELADVQAEEAKKPRTKQWWELVERPKFEPNDAWKDDGINFMNVEITKKDTNGRG